MTQTLCFYTHLDRCITPPSKCAWRRRLIRLLREIRPFPNRRRDFLWKNQTFRLSDFFRALLPAKSDPAGRSDFLPGIRVRRRLIRLFREIRNLPTGSAISLGKSDFPTFRLFSRTSPRKVGSGWAIRLLSRNQISPALDPTFPGNSSFAKPEAGFPLEKSYFPTFRLFTRTSPRKVGSGWAIRLLSRHQTSPALDPTFPGNSTFANRKRDSLGKSDFPTFCEH